MSNALLLHDDDSHVTGQVEATARIDVDLLVVVPALNEEARLPRTLHTLTAALAALPLSCAVTVVDNGSTDSTAELVRDWPVGTVPVTLLGCARQGKGAAVRRGILASSARWVGFCDADLATSFDALDAVVDELTGGAAVVVGSRRMASSELVVAHGAVRRIGSQGFRRLVRSLVTDVSDTQCGFKFFQGDVARTIFTACRSDGFAFDVEVLARAQRHGCRVVEVPVTWTAQPGSTFNVLQHGHRTARELLGIHALLRGAPTISAASTPAGDLARAAA